MLEAALALVEASSARAASGIPDNTGDLLREVQVLMSAKAGPVRSAESIQEALVQVHEWLSTYESTVSADASSRRSINRTFLVRDILTSAYVYLSAMADYVAHGGRSRGSVLYTDPSGSIPHGLTELPDVFRFTLDGGALDDEVQETSWVPAEGFVPVVPRSEGDPAGEPVFRWRPRRPIPEDDDFFENVWREFREHGNIH